MKNRESGTDSGTKAPCNRAILCPQAVIAAQMESLYSGFGETVSRGIQYDDGSVLFPLCAEAGCAMSLLPPREPFMSYNFEQDMGLRLNSTYAKGSFGQSAIEK